MLPARSLGARIRSRTWQAPEAAAANKGVTRGLFAVLLVVVILVAIGVVPIAIGVQRWRTALVARSWPVVEGQIVAAAVEETQGSKGTRFYNPHFTCAYEVDGAA